MRCADSVKADKLHEEILMKIVTLKGLLVDPKAAPEAKRDAKRRLMALKRELNGEMNGVKE